MFRKTALIMAALGLLCLFSIINAQDMLYFNYQGRLTDDVGNPLTGNFDLTFTIYNESGGSPVSVWSDQYLAVPVSDGLFSLNIGPIEESVFAETELYLGIRVGADPEISPHTPLTSAPYAAKAFGVVGDIQTGDGTMFFKGTTDDSAIVLDAGSSKGVPAFKMYSPDGFGGRKSMEMIAGPDIGGAFSIFSIDPGDDGRSLLSISGAPSTGASLVMFNPQPEPPGMLFNLTGTAEEGAKMLFFSDGSEVMGVEPTPFHTGYSLKFMEQADSKEMLTISSTFSSGASLVMFNPQPEPPGMLFNLFTEYGAKGSGANMVFYNPDMSYVGDELLSIGTGMVDGASLKMFQPQPEPPGVPPDPCIEMGVDLSGAGSIKMFQPQPEPPGHEAIGMYTQSAKGAGGNVFVRNFADSISTTLGGGEFSLADFKSADGASLLMGLYADSSKMTLTGHMDPTGGPGAFITMFADQNHAHVGIGRVDDDFALFAVGDIGCTGEFYAITDTKLKTNIEPIGNALDIVQQINGVKYDWINSAKSDFDLPDDRQVGLLASDVEKVLPEIVKADENGNKMVAYSKLTAVLVEAVKELKAENDELRQRIEKLEATQ